VELLIAWALIWGIIGAVPRRAQGAAVRRLLISALLGPIGILIVIMSKSDTHALSGGSSTKDAQVSVLC